MKYLLFILSLFTLTSCGKFKDGTSVWGDYLWIIPWVLILGGAILIVLSYFAGKSNSTQQVPGGTRNNTGNIPKTKLAKFWGGVILIVIAIGVIIYQNGQR